MSLALRFFAPCRRFSPLWQLLGLRGQIRPAIDSINQFQFNGAVGLLLGPLQFLCASSYACICVQWHYDWQETTQIPSSHKQLSTMTYNSDDKEEGESFRIFRAEFLSGVQELTKRKCWAGSVIIKKYMRQSNNDVYKAARAYVNDREGARSDESDSSSSATPKKAARPKALLSMIIIQSTIVSIHSSKIETL